MKRRRPWAGSLALCLMLSTDVTLAFENWKSLRDAGVVRQRLDYSCGAAALATLLRWLGSADVSEAMLLGELAARRAETSQPGVQQLPPSLAELAALAEVRGYATAGLAVDERAFASLRVPALIYLEQDEWQHFSVLRGVNALGDVELADPSWGNRRMSRARFDRLFQRPGGGRLLLILDPGAPEDLTREFRLTRPRALLGSPASLTPGGPFDGLATAPVGSAPAFP